LLFQLSIDLGKQRLFFYFCDAIQVHTSSIQHRNGNVNTGALIYRASFLSLPNICIYDIIKREE
jgi:hypothetical protein